MNREGQNLLLLPLPAMTFYTACYYMYEYSVSCGIGSHPTHLVLVDMWEDNVRTADNYQYCSFGFPSGVLLPLRECQWPVYATELLSVWRIRASFSSDVIAMATWILIYKRNYIYHG